MTDKCIVNGIHLEPCDTLYKSLEFGHPSKKSKGVFIPERVIFKPGERSKKGVCILQIHSGDYIGNGIAAVYCPFCGVRVISTLETKVASDD